MFELFGDNPTAMDQMWFTDGAHFRLIGHVNKNLFGFGHPKIRTFQKKHLFIRQERRLDVDLLLGPLFVKHFWREQ
jgi:hypothetical protein